MERQDGAATRRAAAPPLRDLTIRRFDVWFVGVLSFCFCLFVFAFWFSRLGVSTIFSV
ncbi:MAG: hypothetical protein LBP95_07875 [Deltaproteobacteria bacterium]|nr:hypothetical protein [Deltaproteobacteria bacterium]